MKLKKTIIAVIAGLAILLAIGGGAIAVKAISAARTTAALSKLQGSWGTLHAGRAQLRLVLTIFPTNGTYGAVIDSVDQGAKDIPVSKLFARPGTFRAELPFIAAVYQATLTSDARAMSGTWKQVKKTFRLTLTRTNAPDTVETAMTADEYAQRPDSDLQGEWEGTLQAGGASLRLDLRIAEPTPGDFQAQMDSIDQGVKNLPVNSMTYQKPAVHFEMTAINGVYQGNVNDRDDQLTGTWRQLGEKYPLTFQRVQTNAPATAEAAKDYGQGSSYQMQGHWKGALSVNSGLLHIVFHIALMPDGSYSATLDSPDQGAYGIPATLAKATYPNIRMEWSAIGGVFTGKLSNGKISGTWHQGKGSLPLELERDSASSP